MCRRRKGPSSTQVYLEFLPPDTQLPYRAPASCDSVKEAGSRASLPPTPYAYPEPDGFSKQGVKPDAAYFSEDWRELLLPYDAVREALEVKDPWSPLS